MSDISSHAEVDQRPLHTEFVNAFIDRNRDFPQTRFPPLYMVQAVLRSGGTWNDVFSDQLSPHDSSRALAQAGLGHHKYGVQHDVSAVSRVLGRLWKSEVNDAGAAALKAVLHVHPGFEPLDRLAKIRQNRDHIPGQMMDYDALEAEGLDDFFNPLTGPAENRKLREDILKISDLFSEEIQSYESQSLREAYLDASIKFREKLSLAKSGVSTQQDVEEAFRVKNDSLNGVRDHLTTSIRGKLPDDVSPELLSILLEIPL